MFMCCMSQETKEDHLKPSYASVLHCGENSLKTVLRDMENQGIAHCVTGWCSAHHCVSVIFQDDNGYFQRPSEYYVHQLHTHELLTSTVNSIFAEKTH
jgi:hypothetical protein